MRRGASSNITSSRPASEVRTPGPSAIEIALRGAPALRDAQVRAGILHSVQKQISIQPGEVIDSMVLNAALGMADRACGDREDFRSEERRVGKECVSTCRFRWSQAH